MNSQTMDHEIVFLSVTELSRLIASRIVSPVEITRALLDRIERYNDTLRSYITICGETALQEAARAEAEISASGPRGPLHGIPVSHKDVLCTAGVRTTAHSATLLEFVPADDATAVANLRLAGMILLGKTSTTEFASGTMDVFGLTRNPWDLTRYTGGSSGGSANALASGLAIAATGSDTGGSIRAPAGFCGIVGLKATYGRVSRYGLLPLSWTQDNVGPMARRVSDCAMLLEAMAGADPLDPTSAAVPVSRFADGLTEGLAGIRLGVPVDHFYTGLDREVESAVQAALRQLEGLGAHLEPVRLPHAGDLASVGGLLVMAEAFPHHAGRLRAQGHKYGARTRQRIAAGAFYTAAEYGQASQVRALWIREVEDALGDVDALVTPTLPITAFSLEVQRSGPPDTSWGTRHFNLSGHPALSLPCGFSASGLPVGLQLAGRYFDEATLFRIGHAYEHATPGSRRRPNLDQTSGLPDRAAPASSRTGGGE
jgi:aspartyl-tRNA(Asn)/glutamyl-tRNA(Gln) amidotransferase subunit A